jgi:hypothetical protein
MAFNRRVDSIFPGMGVPVRNDASYVQIGLAMTTAGSPQTWPLPASGTFTTPFTAGRFRMRVYNGGGTTPTVTDVIFKVSDGTNTISIGGGFLHPNVGVLISATTWLEFEFEFVVDVATTTGTGGGSIGQLLASVGGATSASVITTMTGASGTASLDVEIAPLI